MNHAITFASPMIPLEMRRVRFSPSPKPPKSEIDPDPIHRYIMGKRGMGNTEQLILRCLSFVKLKLEHAKYIAHRACDDGVFV